MDQFMFGSAITANKDASPAFRQQWPEPFLVSCPEPLKQFFCRNGGECYTGYEDREQGYIKTESKANPFFGSRSISSRHGNSIFDLFDMHKTSTGHLSPFCKCAPNYHGSRCEYFFDSDIFRPEFGKRHERIYTYNGYNDNSISAQYHGTNFNVQIDYQSFIFPILILLTLILLFLIFGITVWFLRRRKREYAKNSPQIYPTNVNTQPEYFTHEVLQKPDQMSTFVITMANI